MAGAACGGGMNVPRLDASGTGGIGGSGPGLGKTFEQVLARDVDILFLIDDSSSMRLAQNKLLPDLPTFVTTLQGLPGGPPDVHIGVSR